VRDAIQLSKQTMRQAAQEAEIDQAQFQRQIEMAEGSLKRLAMQPASFWQWLGVTIAAEFGIPAEVEQATRLARASHRHEADGAHGAGLVSATARVKEAMKAWVLGRPDPRPRIEA
jgi:hypothetical protein